MSANADSPLSVRDVALRAKVFDLEQPRSTESPLPPVHRHPGYQFLLHRWHPSAGEGRTGATGTIIASDHAGTHIDALCHQAEDLIYYGNEPVAGTQSGFGITVHGAETIPPIIAHGKLIDLVRYGGKPAEPEQWISINDVQGAAQKQGIVPHSGDVILVRTGAGRLWSAPDEYLLSGGIDRATSEWLASEGVRAVGADNAAWDWAAGEDETLGILPGHIILLVRSGIYIVENLFLEEIGQAEVDEFIFVCLPLKLEGATGSPVRPVAVIL